MADDFGNEEETNNFNNANPGFTRVRLPRQNEILGIIEQRV